MRQLRRRTYYQCVDERSVKALALSLFIKDRIVSSAITNFTYKKLSDLTGLNYRTLKKRVTTLVHLGLAEFTGKDNSVLVFRSVSSHCSKRNIDISFIKLDNIKSIEKKLMALYLVLVQRKKDYVKHIIETRNNATNNKELKEAKRVCKKYGFGESFHDNGISYKYLSEKLKISVSSAVALVKCAVSYGFVEKIRRVECKLVSGASYLTDSIGQGIYLYGDKLFLCLANLYRLTSATSLVTIR